MKKRLFTAIFLISLVAHFWAQNSSPAISEISQKVTIKNGQFYSVYDLNIQCPLQVGYTVTPSDLGMAHREPSWKFIQDVSNPLATGTHLDFVGSGFDRGHLCPAADRSASLQGMKATFVMSNIAPQVPRLNRGAWKMTENFCRSAALLYDSVGVLALPVFLDRDTTFIGSHRLAVPHAFIKVAWLPKNDSIIGLWWFWNK